jgi:hypothetical protein
VSDKRIFHLVHDMARSRAVRCVTLAPYGYAVTVQEPSRNLEQNALLWVLLQAFADQLEWPINGRMCRLEPEEWKDILSAAFRRETQRVAPGIDGGMVLLGLRTSKMGKREFGEFLEFVQATAADRGVELEEAPA